GRPSRSVRPGTVSLAERSVSWGKIRSHTPPKETRRETYGDTGSEPRGDRSAGAQARAPRDGRHLPSVGRGALQALPGLRRQAKRDPREARRGRSLDGEPGLLGRARAQDRPHV